MRVSAVQKAPADLDRSTTIEIVVKLDPRGSRSGVRARRLPRDLRSGLPGLGDYTHASYFDHPLQQAACAQYLDAAVDVGRGDLDPVVTASRDAGVFVYLGIAERSVSGGSIQCSLVAIDPERGVVSVHRELKPTYGERLVWADGDGHGLVAHRFREVVSGLNCWENWMPLARTAMYAQGTEVHVAAWPGSPAHLTTPAVSSLGKAACSSSAPARSCVPITYRHTPRSATSCWQRATGSAAAAPSSSRRRASDAPP